MDIPDKRIRAYRLDIEMDLAPITSHEPRLKLYNMATLFYKIIMWLIVSLLSWFLITNFSSIASFFYLLLVLNSTFQCLPSLGVRSITIQKPLDSSVVLRGFCGVQNRLLSQVPQQRLARNTSKANKLLHYTNLRPFSLPGTTLRWRGSMLKGKPTWPYWPSGNRQAKWKSEISGQSNWCLLQVCLSSAGPLQGRQNNYCGVYGHAHHSNITTHAAPTHRQKQGVL